MRSLSCFILLLMVALGCGKSNSTPTQTASTKLTGISVPSTTPTATTPTTPPTSKAPTKNDTVPTKVAPAKDPLAKITAFQLYEEVKVKKDENWLFTKYQGQVVELTGVVENGSVKNGMLYLVASNDKAPFTERVDCLLKARINPFSKALPGQSVVLRGTVPKEKFDLCLWEIISATGDGPKTLTLDAISNEIKSDPEISSIDKKYEYSQLVVTGEITDIDYSKDAEKDVTTIYIGKKDGPFKIACVFLPTGDSDEMLAQRKSICKVGLKVRVIGQYSGATKDSFSLKWCQIIDPLK